MAELRSKGKVIEYRYCNIPEKLEMLQAIGMTPGNTDVSYDYSVFAKGINYIGFLIKSVSVKSAGGVISTWDDLLEEEEMMSTVIEVFSDILNPPKKKVARSSN